MCFGLHSKRSLRCKPAGYQNKHPLKNHIRTYRLKRYMYSVCVFLITYSERVLYCDFQFETSRLEIFRRSRRFRRPTQLHENQALLSARFAY